jgi:hypothetical protein
MKSHFRPRHTSALMVPLRDELVVYQKETFHAHALNSTAGEVWKLADGTRTVAEIARSLAAKSNTPADEGLVWMTLKKLRKADLLARMSREERELVSRRKFVRQAGRAALVLPVITSILVPEASAATSPCLHNLAPCTLPAQCCSNLCVAGLCVGG